MSYMNDSNKRAGVYPQSLEMPQDAAYVLSTFRIRFAEVLTWILDLVRALQGTMVPILAANRNKHSLSVALGRCYPRACVDLTTL